MTTAKAGRLNGVVALTTSDAGPSSCAIREDLDEIFTGLSHLYQRAKETNLEVILVDSKRHDLTRAVANKLRRNNGLTDIWIMADIAEPDPEVPDYVDGVVTCSDDREALRAILEHVLYAKRLLRDYGIVGRSARMKLVAETIDRVAPTDMAVLIVGPSGAGKELVARAIHSASGRNDKAHVAINCGALAGGVLESELFGHEKGAFTGSVGRREGLFHKATGGTIFLDEIGETKPEMQVKLLRVLEDGTYYPVGSSVPSTADVRVISATNRDLTEAIADGEFREDLYFRIAVLKIVLPPLLERRQDIQPLLQFFWQNQPELSYSDSALRRLEEYDWPGNVRQLRNFADRMVALVGSGLVDVQDVEQFLDEQQQQARHLPVSTGRTVEEAGQELIYRAIIQLGQEVKLLRDLIISHLPSDAVADAYASGTVSEDEEPVRTFEEVEHDLIVRALKRNKGNRKVTAEQLGIGERTLYRKLRKYGLS